MVAMFIMLAAGLVAQTPTVEERVDYYEVAGSSEDELRAAIDKQRPKDRAGERHDAVTDWDVQWEYRFVTSGNGCALGSLVTTLEVVTILPRWPNRQSGRVDRALGTSTSQRSRHTSATIWTSRVVQHR